MSKIPYWIVSHWGFDESKDKKKILVVVLNYQIYKVLKQEHEELQLAYNSLSFGINDTMHPDNNYNNYMYNEENFNKFSPEFDISEELSLYLALIEGKDFLD